MLRRIGFFSCLAFAKRFFAPRIPIDRIMGVLEQIGAGLATQAVGVFVFHGRPPSDISFTLT